MNDETKNLKVKKGLIEETNLLEAEKLLYKSCRSAFNRVRNKTNEVYQGVQIQWNTAKKMKEALMNNDEFWKRWIDLTETYMKNEKSRRLRPTLDRIESDFLKGGHYFEANLRPLISSENSRLGRAVPNEVLLIHNKQPKLLIKSDSIQNTFSELKVRTPSNIHSKKRNTGQLLKINNEYSMLLQSSDKKKVENLITNAVYGRYEARIQTKKIQFEYSTGEEVVLEVREDKLIFDEMYFRDSGCSL